MTQAPTTGTFWRSAGRRWRAGLRRLRQSAAALGLALLLGMWLSEPLLCVLHCQIWLPFAQQSYFATQHQHHHHTQATPAPPESALGDPTQAPNSQICLSAGGDQGPLYVPPTPIHDLVAALAFAGLAALPFVASLPLAPPGKPPHIPPPRHLRPPIGVAA